jgi:hypothetical protein
MEFLHKRALVFSVGPKWRGWFCPRCCWNRPEPLNEDERIALAQHVTAEFEAHECEEFASTRWSKEANPA